MATLGVSVYPDLRPLDEIDRYLALASERGYARVFASMFSVEGDAEEVLGLFHRLTTIAHGHGMSVSVDVNPDCMRRFDATPDDLSTFANIDVDIIRMDGAYGEDDNVRMLGNPYGIRIEYNASALTPAATAALVGRGIDRDRLLVCHNFYPQRYTGLRWDRFREINARLSALDIRIGAFIAAQAPGTHGVWDATCGLPTVERLRDYPADLQARLMDATGVVTDILFGNAYASDDELAGVAEALAPVEGRHLHEGINPLLEELASSGVGLSARQRKVRVEPLYDLSDVEREILFDFYPHVDLGDSSEWIWRTRLPREFYRDRLIVPRRFVGPEFPVGSVLMVNDNYRHYAGEVQVALRPIANDGTRNLIARIDAQEMTMFDVIGDGDVVIFLPAR